VTRALAIILPNWLGDAVMATPALRAMRLGAGPQAHITAFGRRAVCDLLAGNTRVDAFSELPPRGAFPLQQAVRVAADLRAGRFDSVVLLTNGLGVAAAAWLAGIPQRAGYRRRGRSMFLSVALSPPRQGAALKPVPAIDYYLALAAALGAGDTSAQMELATSADDEESARQIWAAFAGREARPTVLLNNNAARNPAKRWPDAAMTELTQRLAARFDVNIGLLAGPGEEARARASAAGAASPRVAALVAPSIGVLKACIRRGALVVSTDSAPRAIAAAFAIPLISLFGPTDPRWTSLRVPSDIELRGNNHAMSGLSVDRVWTALASQLAAMRA
jgi:heptosyltransferase-2